MPVDATVPRFVVAGAFLWLALRLCVRTYPGASRGLRRLGRSVLWITCVRPIRERGIVFGLWHLLFVVAVGATLAVPFLHAPRGGVVAALWAGVLVGRVIARPDRVWQRRHRMLPGRRAPARR